MKVLSIKEPYASLIKDGYKCYETRSFKTNYRGELYIHASLIKDGYKCYETRSFKTNYRGELYIHASLSKCNQSDKLSKLITPMYGEIICKCMLVDCIYMTDEFIENLKKNNEVEYKCGLYEVGRYAWFLENVLVIKPS